MVDKFAVASMKAKSSQIPDSSSERKVSPILGRGARVAKSSRKKRQLVKEDDSADLDDDLDDVDELPQHSIRKRITAQIGSNAKSSKFQPAGDSQVKEEDTGDVSSSPQPAKSSPSDSVQPPPKVSPSPKSTRHDTDSTPRFALEESTAISVIGDKATEEPFSLKRQAFILANLQKILARHSRILAAAAVFLLLLMGFLLGKLQSGSSAEGDEGVLAKPSPQLVKELNEALALIESGDSTDALQKIQALSAKHPDVYSLDYLTAISAMQAGDFKTAQEKASLSITKNQKVSDSLVLLSMTEAIAGAGEKSSLRDPKIVRESLLREAVNADVANPFPMIELASFLRGQKRDDEALELLGAANARLHPINTHVVVQTSIQLMKLQQMPDEELPAACSEGSITEIFSSVYISLRKKDYKQAAIALEKGRHQASPDLFAYLINDPVFKPFHAEPVMTRVL